jgi:hypothetical protein
VQRDESVQGADSSVDLAKAGVRILNGLRSLHVLSNTGQGRDMAAAKNTVRAAWEHREVFFTAAQRKQLEAWLRSSKRLAALLPRDAGLYEAAQPPLPPRQATSEALSHGVLPRHAAPARAQSPAVPGPPPPPPPPPASRGASAAAAALLQPVTTSVGDKRSHASEGDTSSSGASGKRPKASLQAAPAAVPPPPPLPPSPLHAASVSMELAESMGAPSVAGLVGDAQQQQPQPEHMSTADSPADLDLLGHAESALRASPPAASQFHGVAVSEDVRGLLG